MKASFAQVAVKENIPMMVICVISDNAKDNSVEDFVVFIENYKKIPKRINWCFIKFFKLIPKMI